MDRAHRIGQTRPVLVLRLATAHSVEGRLLRRANSKLALERLVIKRGQFLPEPSSDAGEATGMTQQELLELLRNDSASNDEPQSGTVTDKVRAVCAAWLPVAGRCRKCCHNQESGCLNVHQSGRTKRCDIALHADQQACLPHRLQSQQVLLLEFDSQYSACLMASVVC